MWGDVGEMCGDMRRCGETMLLGHMGRYGGDMGRYGGDVRRCGGGMGRYGEIRGDMGTCSVTERSSMVSATTALLRALCFRPSALLIWQGSGSGSGSDLGSGLGAG